MDSYRYSEQYREHVVTVATWPKEDGKCESSFGIEPPINGWIRTSVEVFQSSPYGSVEEARMACVMRAKAMIDEKTRDAS